MGYGSLASPVRMAMRPGGPGATRTSQRFSHNPGDSAIRPKTRPAERTIATGKVSRFGRERSVPNRVRALTGPENEANSPSSARSSEKVTVKRCGVAAVTSSVRSTSDGVFCVMRQRKVSAPIICGPSSRTPARSVLVLNRTAAHSAPGSFNSTPAGAASVERPTSVSPERYSTATTPSFSTTVARSGTVSANASSRVKWRVNRQTMNQERIVDRAVLIASDLLIGVMVYYLGGSGCQ